MPQRRDCVFITWYPQNGGPVTMVVTISQGRPWQGWFSQRYPRELSLLPVPEMKTIGKAGSNRSVAPGHAGPFAVSVRRGRCAAFVEVQALHGGVRLRA